MKNKKMYLSLLGLAAIVLQVSAISTEYWSVVSNVPAASSIAGAKMNVNWGLWKACGNMVVGGKQSPSACNHLPPTAVADKYYKKNSLYAARAFAVMGPILVSLALSGLYLFPMKQKLICALLLMGALSSLLAMVIWAAELLKPDSKNNVVSGSPGYSFYLNLSGGVLALIAVYVCQQM